MNASRRKGGQRNASPARVVVIGASAGGVHALQALAAALPADFPAAVLVVLHVGSHPSIMPKLMSRSGPLPATHAGDGEPFRCGHIHIAPPDHHLLVDGARLRLSRGPKEHHARPAVDPLFRSAALALGPALVGVVLTGRLDDGTAGLQAIKACGGITVVQDPADAVEPSMPASALRYVPVDHCVPLAALGGLLTTLVRADAAPVIAPAVDVADAADATAVAPGTAAHEHALALSQGDPMQHLQAIATPSPFVCPDCSGGLWQIGGAMPPRYRCHTGHAYTLRTLLHAQGEACDEAAWGALRALQEHELLLRTLLDQQRLAGDRADVAAIEQRIGEAARQADLLRKLLEQMPEPAPG